MSSAEWPLGSGVGRGRTGTSRMLLTPREEGYQQVLLGLFRLLKSAEEAGTQALHSQETLNLFLDPLRVCLEQEGSLLLGEREGHLYLNGLRAHIDLEVFPALKYLVQSFRERNLLGLLFDSGIDAEELGRFLVSFLIAEDMPGEFGINQDLQTIHPLLRDSEDGSISGLSRIDPGTVFTSRQTWFKNILVVKHLLQGRSSSCPVDVDEAMHILQDLAQVILSNEAFLLALDELEDWDPRLFSHSVDVALISVQLGRRMGLDQDQLNELGVSALVHDVGFVDLDAASQLRQKEFRSRESSGEGRHESRSFRRLARHAVGSRLVMRSSLVAYRHHQQGSLLPYPAPEEEGRRALLTALVEVVDTYDRLIKGDDQGGVPRSPNEALEALGPPSEYTHPDLIALLRETVAPLTA